MTTSKEKCTLQQEKYHAMFADIPTMTSEDWISRRSNVQPGKEEDKNNNDIKYVLVDVRSKEERNVSIIPESITLKEFENKMQKSSINSNTSTENNVNNIHVVTYCTIGYRSGVEARRLRDKYGLDGRIYNLDGIVPYTHSCIINSKDGIDATNSISKEHQSQVLVDPKTGEETNKVHCYGATWAECVNTDYFEPIIFTKQSLMIQNLKKTCIII